MKNNINTKISIYADGANLKDILELNKVKYIKGFKSVKNKNIIITENSKAMYTKKIKIFFLLFRISSNFISKFIIL